jgi:hypothetical protein
MLNEVLRRDVLDQTELLDGDLQTALVELESDLQRLPAPEALQRFKEAGKASIAVRFDPGAAIARLRGRGVVRWLPATAPRSRRRASVGQRSPCC